MGTTFCLAQLADSIPQCFPCLATHCVFVATYIPTPSSCFFKEAKILVAQAYRRTEKLLLENRDKLQTVS